ncbi:porin family protein [Mesorhizobium sp. NZP2077]|nr:porin family protein [Mesorhizobium sp. NZP2077]QKD20173.1 porin family protein [Mesorhizobium sp. NZP2077]
MISILLAGLVSLVAGSAIAADAVATDPVTTVNWSGAYIGAVAGYGWGSQTYNYVPATLSVDFDANGFVGGLTGGYNWQNDRFVLGVEGDISYANIRGDVLEPPVGAPCYIEGCSAKVSWFGTGRARLGYAFENLLPYVTGGFAVGRVKGSADLGACGGGATCGYSDTRWGWSAGAGVEWAMNQHLSLKAEYLHVDLGKPDFEVVSTTSDAIKLDTVRVGINYHF